MKKPRKKPDAMDELATKILRTNHPLVLDNIVWLRDAIADALRAVERRERRRSSALLRERADAARTEADQHLGIFYENSANRERDLDAIREAEERGARWALEKLTPENDDHDESCESDWDNQAHCATPCGCRSREAERIVRAAREQERT